MEVPPKKMGEKRMSEKQKDCLIELLEKDENLRNGTFSNEFTYKMAKERWEQIAEQLNDIPGAHKTAIQWKKTWIDRKHSVKKKLRDFEDADEGQEIVVSRTDGKILDILGVTDTHNHSDIPVCFVDNENHDVPTEITLEMIEDSQTLATDPLSETICDDHVHTKKAIRQSKSNRMKMFPRKKKRFNSHMKSKHLSEFSRKDSKMRQDFCKGKEKEVILDNYYRKKLEIEKQKNELDKQLIELERQKIVLEKQKLELDREEFEIEKSIMTIDLKRESF